MTEEQEKNEQLTLDCKNICKVVFITVGLFACVVVLGMEAFGSENFFLPNKPAKSASTVLVVDKFATRKKLIKSQQSNTLLSERISLLTAKLAEEKNTSKLLLEEALKNYSSSQEKAMEAMRKKTEEMQKQLNETLKQMKQMKNAATTAVTAKPTTTPSPQVEKNEKANMCLHGQPMGQSGNIMLSIIHAAPAVGFIGLNSVFSNFYVRWFEPNDRVKLNYNGLCNNKITAIDSFYKYKTKTKFNRKDWPNYIKLKSEKLAKAREILKSFNGPVATVHGRWLSGECDDRANKLKTFCTNKKNGWKETCHYTSNSISKLVPKNIKTILYLTDNQRPEYTKTFKNVDKHPFDVQIAMMIESEYHFGNAMSSIDYLISKWRQKKNSTYPEQCYAEQTGNFR